MAQPNCPDVIVYLCVNCVSQDGRLPRQWKQDDAHVLVREVPCSGKIDTQYLLSTMEGGGRGVCVATCAKGECRLSQGNYRAEVRIQTVRRLLAEIGIEPERAELLRCSADDPFEKFEKLVRDAVTRICALGKSPIHVEAPCKSAADVA